MTNNYFFFGFGQVAKYYVDELIKKKKKFNFFVTTTSNSSTKRFKGKAYRSFKFNGNKYDKKIFDYLKSSNYLLISIPPSKGKDYVLSNFGKIIKSINFKKIIYLSATSVYGNHNGKWVSEKSNLKPSTEFGKSRLKAEKRWLKISKKKNFNLVILRLSGIYSKENNPLMRLKAGPKTFISKKNQFFSRIRVEDISRVLDKIFNDKKISREIINISDDLPASNENVTKFAAKLLSIKNLKSISYKNLEGKMIKGFYKDSKKVSNKKMKSLLNIKLLYPDYKSGLRNLFRKSF